MNVIKNNVFPFVEKSVSCSYPTPKSIESQPGSDLSTKMKMFLERKLQLKNFETELPNLFEYLLKKQHNPVTNEYGYPVTNEYGWLRDFCDIRNKLSHKVGAEQLLKEKYPNLEDQRKVANQMSVYAAEVWNRFQSKIHNRQSNLD